jgi:hypothetical protein
VNHNILYLVTHLQKTVATSTDPLFLIYILVKLRLTWRSTELQGVPVEYGIQNTECISGYLKRTAEPSAVRDGLLTKHAPQWSKRPLKIEKLSSDRQIERP